MVGDVIAQVLLFLEHTTQRLQGQGVDLTRICIDPGIGFGKTVAQNFTLLARQQELGALGFPVLAGWSRKSSLAVVTRSSPATGAEMDVRQRMVPSVAAALLAVDRGARVVRVHDVTETVQALNVWSALQTTADSVGATR
jgi:dihydropteroate synthase